MKIAATTGIEFGFDVVRVGQEPTLVRKSFKLHATGTCVGHHQSEDLEAIESLRRRPLGDP